MDYQQKFAAIKSLCPSIHLSMRKVGDWYVSLPGLERSMNSMLMSLGDSGRTPEEAIEHTWAQLTNIPFDSYIVIGAMGPHRKHYRWNDFMWEEVGFKS